MIITLLILGILAVIVMGFTLLSAMQDMKDDY